MSTIAFAQLTNLREQATPGKSTTDANPGLRTYIDTFTALVPAEVLTLHALIIAAATTPISTTKDVLAANQTATKITTLATEISQSGLDTLRSSFWILLAMSVVLYVVPRHYGGKWDRYDFIRACMAPLAFMGWTMLSPVTAFDAAFPDMDPIKRTVFALILGSILGAVTVALAAKADAKPTP
jgi:hypothetical protein